MFLGKLASFGFNSQQVVQCVSNPPRVTLKEVTQSILGHRDEL